MDNLEIIKQGYGYFAKGNIPAVLSLFHSDIEWNESKGFPFVKGSGIFVGHGEIVEGVFSQLAEFYDNFNIEIREIFGCGDKVVMMGYYKGTLKETGKDFKANAVHVWTLKEGKATNFFQAVDTASVINP